MFYRYFLLSLLSILISNAKLYSQTELWSKTAGGSGDDEAETVSIDASGNVYITGFFKSSSLTLGDKTFANKGVGASDVYFAKYDPSGKLLWAKTVGGAAEDEPLGMSLDKSGNIIVRGFFESNELSFDGVVVKNNNNGDLSMFLVKYDPSGKILWAKGAEVFASAHVLDANGNVYVTGEVTKGVNTNFDNTHFVPLEDGTFVAKYSPDGKVLWVKKGTGSEPFAISADAAGNVMVTGMITQREHLMEGGQKIINIGPNRTSDIFIMKMNADGKIIWEKNIAGLGDEEPRAQFVNPGGNLYMVIRFTSINLNLGKDNHKNGGGDDLLLIKFDMGGNILWSKSAGGSGHDNPIFLVSDPSENIYIVGHFYSDQITFDHLTLKNVGLNDIFLVKFAPDSKVLWAKTTGGSHHDYPNGLVVDKSGNAYLIGEFNSSPNKDKITSEFFMEKYDVSGNSVWKSAEHRTESFDFAFGESVDLTNHLYMVGYFGGTMKFAGKEYKSSGGKDMFILKYDVGNEKVATQDESKKVVEDKKSNGGKTTKKK